MVKDGASQFLRGMRHSLPLRDGGEAKEAGVLNAYFACTMTCGGQAIEDSVLYPFQTRHKSAKDSPTLEGWRAWLTYEGNTNQKARLLRCHAPFQRIYSKITMWKQKQTRIQKKPQSPEKKAFNGNCPEEKAFNQTASKACCDGRAGHPTLDTSRLGCNFYTIEPKKRTAEEFPRVFQTFATRMRSSALVLWFLHKYCEGRPIS